MAISHRKQGVTRKKGEQKGPDLLLWLTTDLWYTGNIQNKQRQHRQDKEKLNATRWYSTAHNENIAHSLQLLLGFQTSEKEKSDSNAKLF